MYSRLTEIGDSREETIEKPVGPYRIHSSGSSVSVLQTSETFGVSRSILIAPPIRYPMIRERDEARCPSQSEDFDRLMLRHKPALDLLAQ